MTKLRFTSMSRIQKLDGHLLRRTLLKKGLSSNSSPKTSCFIFSQIGHTQNKKALQQCRECPSEKKSDKKSLEKGLGKSLSSERFSPIKNYKLLYVYHTCETLFLSVSSIFCGCGSSCGFLRLSSYAEVCLSEYKSDEQLGYSDKDHK